MLGLAVESFTMVCLIFQVPELIDNITLFKSRLPLYPLPQPALDIYKRVPEEEVAEAQ